MPISTEEAIIMGGFGIETNRLNQFLSRTGACASVNFAFALYAIASKRRFVSASFFNVMGQRKDQ